MSTKANRAPRRRTRRPAGTHSNRGQPVAPVAAPAKRRGLQPRSASPRWMLLAAIISTIAACADAALIATSSGSDFWLYVAGIVLWILLAAYHWNRWLQLRHARPH